MMRKWAFIFIALALVVYFLPYMLSWGWAKSQVQTHLERQLGGKVCIGKLTLSWWGKQHCQNVAWKDDPKGFSVYAERVEVLAGLIDCLRYKDKPLDVFVEGATMKSQANLRFFKKKKKKDLEMHFSPIRAILIHKIIRFEHTQIQINDSMHVFTSGEIDLERDSMNIQLGLPQKALGKIFKEARNLPEDFVLEIPVATKLSGKALEKALLGFFLKNFGSIGK